MKKLSRDAKLALWILLILAVFSALAAMQQQSKPQYPKLSSLSSGPDGALALKLWIQSLHYPVDEQLLTSFNPPRDSAILLMLEPAFPTNAELKSMNQWVENGGTLIAIGDQYGMYDLAGYYDFAFEYLVDNNVPPNAETPLLDSPAVLDLKNLKVQVALGSAHSDYVVLADRKSTV